jgi:hypothetical protein
VASPQIVNANVTNRNTELQKLLLEHLVTRASTTEIDFNVETYSHTDCPALSFRINSALLKDYGLLTPKDQTAALKKSLDEISGVMHYSLYVPDNPETSLFAAVYGAYDPKDKRVYFAFPNADSA